MTGATVWSVPVKINTDGRTNVLSPTGSTTNRRPVISWQPVDLAVRYELWVDQLGVDEKIIYQTNLTSTSFTPPSNLPLGNYRIWVRAVSSSLIAARWSPPVDFTIAKAESAVDSGNDFALLTSIFSDAPIVQLLEENSHSPKTPAREIEKVPESPQEVSAMASTMPAFESQDALRAFAVNGPSPGLDQHLNVWKKFMKAWSQSEQFEAE